MPQGRTRLPDSDRGLEYFWMPRGAACCVRWRRSSLLAGSGYHVLAGVSEPDPVVTHHVTTSHSEHLRSGTLDDSYPCRPIRPQVKRQDRLCRCGQILLLSDNDMVEMGDDCAEHPEATNLILRRAMSFVASA